MGSRFLPTGVAGDGRDARGALVGVDADGSIV